MYLYLKGHGAMTDVSVLEGTRSYATALALHPDSSPHAQGGTSADELGSEDVSEESDSTGGASAPAEQQLQEQAASQPDHPAAAGVTAPTSASLAASTHVLGAATSASQESLHAPSAAVGGSSIGAGEAGAAAGSARPVSIEEFCAVNGLSSYVGKMLENEIELDVLPGLSVLVFLSTPSVCVHACARACACACVDACVCVYLSLARSLSLSLSPACQQA